MGKSQSKHGECYLVNAHFNPLCQLEESNSVHSGETRLTSQDSGLQLTPEISFTLSEDNKLTSENHLPTKCALEVFLPQKGSVSMKNVAMDGCPADIECTVTDNDKVTLECVQNNHSEKQEFSFVLRNYRGQELDKDSIEKIVLRSICEVLKSSLKLPPSGTQTLKVHLTVSPDSDKDTTEPSIDNGTKDTTDTLVSESQCPDSSKHSVNPLQDPCQQSDDELRSCTSSPTKHLFSKCCQKETCAAKPMYSPRLETAAVARSKRKKLLSHKREELRRWIDTADSCRKDCNPMNIKCSPQHSTAQEKQSSYVDNCNYGNCTHYLDLAELKIADPKRNDDKTDHFESRHINPAYCSPRHIDKNYYHKSNKHQDFSSCHSPKRNNLDFEHKLQAHDLHAGLLKHRFLQRAKDNAADLGIDMCDAEDKEFEDHIFQHRRSRSYDTNQYSLLSSPKVRHKSCSCPKCAVSTYNNSAVPLSPSRHHRHRHREREKDKIRAMQQVARWLENEDHTRSKWQDSPNRTDAELCSQKDSVVERHEYHHIHEHHHYYHYVEP